MQILQTFAGLFSNFGNLTWQMVVMWVIGGLLIYLAIVKKMEPSLLLPMGTPWGRSRRCLRRACPTNCFRCCCSSASAR